MQVINVQQGSDEWIMLRGKYHTASEASAMMGASKKCTRNELLHMKATGSDKEFSDWVQKNLLDKGHEIEAKARPLAEDILGEELFPATAVNGNILASYDGIDMLETIGWECKMWNEQKAAVVREGRIPEEDRWQVVQQLAVGVEKVLYMVTDGTEENTVYTWVELSDADLKALFAGWTQFDKDLENYEPQEVKPEAVGRSPDSLPALHIEVQGMVTASNLDEFKENALAVFSGINTDLQTDSDFADAEKTVKWCKEVETKLEAAKDHALSQTATIDELFRAIDSIKNEAKAKRLELDKLVKARKQSIRVEIQQKAQAAFVEHINNINKGLGVVCIPQYRIDFAGAMKNKRTIASLQDAVDTVLAQAKIDTNACADEIRINLNTLEELATDHRFLFNDLQSICTKPTDDFTALVKLRIAEHKEAEERRQKAEQERRQQEDEAKAQAKTETPAESKQEPASESPIPISSASEKNRPTDMEMIGVLALHYRVHESKIIEWLLEIDLESANGDLIANF